MFNYLIGKKGHRQPLWVFGVVVFFIVMIFEFIDLFLELLQSLYKLVSP